jgi:hypothetical protein
MAGRRDHGIGARLAIGGIAGLAATFALTSTARRLLPKSDAPAPDLIDLVAPFAFGALCGAVLAAADPRPGRVTGALAGGSLWLAGEIGLLPAVTIGPARGRPARRAVAMLAGHLAWGWSAAEAIRELSSDA